MANFQFRPTTTIHIGKAGGGTVSAVFNALNKRQKKFHAPRQRYPNTDGHVFLVTIRDPVDRFVSAFHWAGRVACQSNDTREVATKENWHRYNYTELGIKSMCKPETNLVDSKYNFNVNNLAEALCEKGEEKYVKQIEHMKYSIVDYISKLLNERERTSFKFMVMEPEYDFLSQILSAIEVVVNMTIKENGSLIPKKLREHLYEKKPLDFLDDRQHSSQINISSVAITNEPLTALGACCVARHYETDYQLLEELNEEGSIVCDGHTRNDCVNAIKSILKRRSLFYKNIDNQSCYEITEEMKLRSTKINSAIGIEIIDPMQSSSIKDLANKQYSFFFISLLIINMFGKKYSWTLSMHFKFTLLCVFSIHVFSIYSVLQTFNTMTT